MLLKWGTGISPKNDGEPVPRWRRGTGTKGEANHRGIKTHLSLREKSTVTNRWVYLNTQNMKKGGCKKKKKIGLLGSCPAKKTKVGVKPVDPQGGRPNTQNLHPRGQPGKEWCLKHKRCKKTGTNDKCMGKRRGKGFQQGGCELTGEKGCKGGKARQCRVKPGFVREMKGPAKRKWKRRSLGGGCGNGQKKKKHRRPWENGVGGTRTREKTGQVGGPVGRGRARSPKKRVRVPGPPGLGCKSDL